MKCKVCKTSLTGRSDKIFCSLSCKNYYHLNLRRATKVEAQTIDRILHRNRSILLEIMGKYKRQMKISRRTLDKKKFNFTYHTHMKLNSHGKTYFFLYDFAYVEFSNDELLIIRNKWNSLK